MRLVPFVLIDIAAAFALFTFYVLFDVGVVEAFSTMGQSLVTWQMTGDIVLGLGAAVALMVFDSRQSGIRVTPYAVATLCLGAPGPLLYLAHRTWRLRQA